MVLVAQTPSPCSERSPRRSQISPVRYTHMPETPHADLPQSHRQLAQWLDAVATPAKSAPAIPTAIPSAMQFAQRWLPGGALSASLRAPATSATPASEGSTRQAPFERPSPLTICDDFSYMLGRTRHGAHSAAAAVERGTRPRCCRERSHQLDHAAFEPPLHARAKDVRPLPRRFQGQGGHHEGVQAANGERG